MQLLFRRCAGLDVHQKTVVACMRWVQGARVDKEVRTFATTVAGLLELLRWLQSHDCEAAVMESTGVYWKPVWAILEGHMELVLANAQEVRNLPGRKTDVRDADWLSDLIAHGLIRSSFVPSAPLRKLRDLTRTRTQLTREINRHTLRLQKTLEDANIKLTERPLRRPRGERPSHPRSDDRRHHRPRNACRAAPQGRQGDAGRMLASAARPTHRPSSVPAATALGSGRCAQDAIAKLDERIAEQLDPFRPRTSC